VKLFNLQATSNVNQHIHAYLNEMAKAKLLQELPNNSVLREEAKTLYRLLLKPIEPYLRGKEKLFISPDGLLNLIPFEVLITPEDKTLMEDYIIYRGRERCRPVYRHGDSEGRCPHYRKP
jgi:CHAT domain-containing protein